MMKKFPLFVALDVDNEKQALKYADLLGPYVLGFKAGPRLLFSSSSSFVKELSQRGKVFLDFKFYDIPSTMAASVRAGFEMGADYLTIHAQAGPEALRQVFLAGRDYKGQVLAVTVLTSQSVLFQAQGVLARKTQSSSGNQQALLKKVLNLAQAVAESGLSGLVASPFEAGLLREKHPRFFIATPGVRVEGSSIAGDDQARTASPEFALRQGASALVMGRPILRARDPVAVLKKCFSNFS